MKLRPNQTALLTGASGGLGTYIARALAAYGINQALVAFPGKDLPPLKEELEKNGINAYYLVADLRLKEERQRIVDEVSKTFGQIDILINNAGVEFTAPYHALSEDDITSVIEVNLVSTDAFNSAGYSAYVGAWIGAYCQYVLPGWKSRACLPGALCCNQIGTDRIYYGAA